MCFMNCDNHLVNKLLQGAEMQEEKIFNALYSKYGKFVISKKDTAKELNISPIGVDRLRKNGLIQSKKIGGQIFFGIDEIARFLEVA